MSRIDHARARWLAEMICPHEPALRRWLLRRAPSISDVDDIVQEAYARLAALPCVDHVANPRAYFFQAAFSIFANEVRRAQVVPIDAIGELERLKIELPEPPPDVQLESREELRLVAEAIGQLPPKCQDAFVLRKVHGLSQREAASRLGISESTIEKHIASALRHLSKILSDGGNDEGRVSIIRRMEAKKNARARSE